MNPGDQSLAGSGEAPTVHSLHAFHGGCHCGAMAFTFETAKRPRDWRVRACQCGFCRRHGARTMSDPDGRIHFHIRDESKVSRYRFGMRTADFLVCGICGVYVAAVLDTPHGRFATLNVNTIAPAIHVHDAMPMTYDDASETDRTRRRQSQWTPVVSAT